MVVPTALHASVSSVDFVVIARLDLVVVILHHVKARNGLDWDLWQELIVFTCLALILLEFFLFWW